METDASGLAESRKEIIFSGDWLENLQGRISMRRRLKTGAGVERQ